MPISLWAVLKMDGRLSPLMSEIIISKSMIRRTSALPVTVMRAAVFDPTTRSYCTFEKRISSSGNEDTHQIQ